MGQAADELREDIERTREDLATTVDAIGNQVSPKLAAQRQMGKLRDAGVEPQKAAMIGGGVLAALLMLRRRRRKRRAEA